jgi:uncharacterized protein YjiS (DUF1127 family)
MERIHAMKIRFHGEFNACSLHLGAWCAQSTPGSPASAYNKEEENPMTDWFKADRSKADGSIASESGLSFRVLLTWIIAIKRAWTSRRAARRTYHQLMSLSDRELSDIGLTRNAIQSRILAPAVEARANRPISETAETPLTVADLARLSSRDRPPAPANQNAFKQRSAS